MKRLFLAILTAAAISMGFFGTVSADTGPAKEVVILRFDTFDVEQAVMDQFYAELHDAIDRQDSMQLADGGDVSMEDLLLMGGCESPSPECLGMLQDFVDGDHLIFGSVQRSDDVHMFSLRMFNFDNQSFTHEISDQTLRGDDSWLTNGIPAVIEHFFFGKTSSLHVAVEGQPQAEVRLNGNPAGQGTLSVDGLAPGEMVVVVSTPDGQEDMQRAILRHDEETRMEFDFEAAEEVPGIVDPGTPDRPSILPGLALVGVGAAGLVVGVIGNSQLTAAEEAAADLVAGRQALDENQLSDAQDLQSDMNTAHTMRVVGFSAGAIGLAAGGAMLFVALTGDSAGDTDSTAISKLPVDFSLGLSRDEVSAGFRFDF